MSFRVEIPITDLKSLKNLPVVIETNLHHIEFQIYPQFWKFLALGF